MKCPHCYHPLTDMEVADLVGQAVTDKVRQCEHDYTRDPDDPAWEGCLKCGQPRPREVT
jgi:hypothetical protein